MKKRLDIVKPLCYNIKCSTSRHGVRKTKYARVAESADAHV